MKKTNLWWAVALLAAPILISSCASESGEGTADVPAINVAYMDTTVRPQDDFYRFVNGTWIDNTEIPGDQGRWGSFNELREASNDAVLKVLTEASESGKYAEGTDQRKAADFYKIGMDSALANTRGITPIQPYLDQINQIKTAAELQKYLAVQQQIGGSAFFSFGILGDLKNTSVMATYLFQGGLGLPERDYYFKEDDRSKEIREKYVAHVARMLAYVGYSADEAAKAATDIMALETRLAEASMTNVEQRNIPALYNKMSIDSLNRLVPSLDFAKYLSDLGVSNIDTMIVGQPKFMTRVNEVVQENQVALWQDYLRWNLINTYAGFLSQEIDQANFDFYSKELNGIEQMRPRWKRVLATTGSTLGEALGQLYVEKNFPPEAKEKAKEMVENIKIAMGNRIKNLEWMSDSTKEMALKKLSTFTVKIGYPDKWEGYADLQIDGNPETASYATNVMNSRVREFKKEVGKLGKPVDKSTWGMTPQTVNAYYNPLWNEIVFPAAILQPPFYNYKADEAVNYGGIGAVIGHEISHGFDDQGSRFDAEGNMVNWWSESDLANFKSRNAQLIAQYDAYEPLPGVKVNGAFTLGENIGDLGGISVAYDGLQLFLEKNGRPELIDGFTPEQRFFISWATVWRNKSRDEAIRTQVQTDPHSPAMYRGNGPLVNVEAFYQAFDVKEGDAMYRKPEERVKIW
ncbi:M13 family metallopeptidase [Cytophagales bacterium LB-30]|uniref:M13 family metallopeptidase n=1 Tax=Shiella aurantiaca TaxID=3058365 RepID=A0ABT8F6F6_9BACT|nr:M13 family metallopeptidase [Shiella aurantiaca]MDN4166030.1 M13 family metallopeptidase [Shiella aurantiaca]